MKPYAVAKVGEQMCHFYYVAHEIGSKLQPYLFDSNIQPEDVTFLRSPSPLVFKREDGDQMEAFDDDWVLEQEQIEEVDLDSKNVADSETESAYIRFQSGKTKKNPSVGNIIHSDSSSGNDYEKDVGLRKSTRQCMQQSPLIGQAPAMKLFRNFEEIDPELALRPRPSNAKAAEGNFLALGNVNEDVQISPPEVSPSLEVTENFPSAAIPGTQPVVIVRTFPAVIIPTTQPPEAILQMSQPVFSLAPLLPEVILEISPVVTNLPEVTLQESGKAPEADGVKGAATQQAVIKVKTEVVDPDDCHPRVFVFENTRNNPIVLPNNDDDDDNDH
jgi:hypothetical protein